MGVYALTWGASVGIGPVIGGLLSDRFSPVAIWYAGLGMGLAAAACFALLSRAKSMDALSNIYSARAAPS
jgi:hypothetical protein